MIYARIYALTRLLSAIQLAVIDLSSIVMESFSSPANGVRWSDCQTDLGYKCHIASEHCVTQPHSVTRGRETHMSPGSRGRPPEYGKSKHADPSYLHDGLR